MNRHVTEFALIMNTYNNQEGNRNTLQPGTELQNGKYRIERPLGAGGFGNTYVVLDVDFQERFAMKEFFLKGISERRSDSTIVTVPMEENKNLFDSQKRKFEREAKFLLRLYNKHIVPVRGFFQENETAYYIMDLVEGESLSALMKRTGAPMAEQEVVSIMKQLLEALREVHSKKIWHLDIKPGNIIRRPDGTIVLIDFGASKQIDRTDGLTATTTALSYTRGYAPAEQIDQNHELIGPWTDLFAVGATLYNLLSNNTPPNISLLGDESAYSFPPTVSQPMRNLIMWMMQPQIRKRPQSVYDVAEWLLKNMGKGGNANINRNAIDDTVVPVTLQEKEIAQRGRQKLEDAETVVARKDTSSNVREQKPKRDIKPEPQPIQQEDEKPEGNKKTVLIAVASAVVGLIAVLAFTLGGNKDNAEPANTDTEAITTETSNTVTDKQMTIADFGDCTYTGEVDGVGLPHGWGEATFSDGQYYKGQFEHGMMHGKGATYRYKNEYVFEGEFYRDKFKEGKITWNDNGECFIGTFAGGKPDKGTWYDKNGNKKLF